MRVQTRGSRSLNSSAQHSGTVFWLHVLIKESVAFLVLILVCGGNFSLVMRVRIKDIDINVCIFDNFSTLSFVTFTLFTSSLFPSLPVSLLWPGGGYSSFAQLDLMVVYCYKARLHKPPPVATHRLSQRLVCPPTSLPLF